MFSSIYAPHYWFSLPKEICYSPYPAAPLGTSKRIMDGGLVTLSPSKCAHTAVCSLSVMGKCFVCKCGISLSNHVL